MNVAFLGHIHIHNYHFVVVFYIPSFFIGGKFGWAINDTTSPINTSLYDQSYCLDNKNSKYEIYQYGGESILSIKWANTLETYFML